MHQRKYFNSNFFINEIFSVEKFPNYGISDRHFPFFTHDSGKKVITFEWLQPQTQNRHRSVPHRTAIHLSSNKWLNV